MSTVPKDFSDVMNKIKTKVMKEAVRVYEFMKDYDKLRTGRMLKTSFPRALDLCALGLTPSEINTVMEWLVPKKLCWGATFNNLTGNHVYIHNDTVFALL